MRRWLALALIVTISVVATAQGAAALMATEIAPEYNHRFFVYDAATENVSTEGQPVEISPVGSALSAPLKTSTVRLRQLSGFVAPRTGGTTLVADDLVSKRVAERGDCPLCC